MREFDRNENNEDGDGERGIKLLPKEKYKEKSEVFNWLLKDALNDAPSQKFR